MAGNPWITFLSAYRKKHSSLNMKQAMKAAAKEYKKKAPAKKKGKKK